MALYGRMVGDWEARNTLYNRDKRHCLASAVFLWPNIGTSLIT